MDLKFLVSVFPIVFMLHDFEEIIFFNVWFTQNKEWLKSTFPRLSKRILPHMERLSTAGFTLAVAEEFVLLSIVTYTAIGGQFYFLWFAVFMAFSIHLVGHLIQWLIIRRYIPSIVTSLFCLPYCLYTFYRFLAECRMSGLQIVLWTAVGIVIMVLNLVVAHRLALVFEKGKRA